MGSRSKRSGTSRDSCSLGNDLGDARSDLAPADASGVKELALRVRTEGGVVSQHGVSFVL